MQRCAITRCSIVTTITSESPELSRIVDLTKDIVVPALFVGLELKVETELFRPSIFLRLSDHDDRDAYIFSFQVD